MDFFLCKGVAANVITKLLNEGKALNKDNDLLQMIHNKKDNRFDKEILTLLSING